MSQAITYKKVLYTVTVTELKSKYNSCQIHDMTRHVNYKQIINVKGINNNIYITLKL